MFITDRDGTTVRTVLVIVEHTVTAVWVEPTEPTPEPESK